MKSAVSVKNVMLNMLSADAVPNWNILYSGIGEVDGVADGRPDILGEADGLEDTDGLGETLGVLLGEAPGERLGVGLGLTDGLIDGDVDGVTPIEEADGPLTQVELPD